MMQLRSESLFGLSLVTLTFDDDAEPFISRMQVAQRMAQADLPDGVTPKLAPEATPLGEVYQFRVTSDRHDLYQTRAELEWTITRVLKQVPGVADVVTFGGYLKEVHVRAYPDRLRAHGITLTEVGDALAKTNINVGGGFVRHGDQELTVRGIGYIASVEDIRRTVLKARDGTPVMVGDIAEIVQSNTPRRGAVGWNEQKEAVEGFVLMRRSENPSRVLQGVHEKIEDLAVVDPQLSNGGGCRTHLSDIGIAVCQSQETDSEQFLERGAREWLFEKRQRALFHGRQRNAEIAMAAHHEDRVGRSCGEKLPLHLEPVDIRHAQVEQETSRL